MKRILVILVVAALVIVTPIAIKFGFDAKQLRHDLATQIDTLTVLKTELKSANDTLGVRVEQLATVTGQLDSVSSLHERALKQINQLSVKVSRLVETADSIRTASNQLAVQLSERSEALTGAKSQLADTSKRLTDVRLTLDSTSTVLKERSVFIVELQPWYEKWKHDATERNWLEKIFGADKAKSPGFPEPAFPVISSTPADSVAQDTSAAMQASQ